MSYYSAKAFNVVYQEPNDLPILSGPFDSYEAADEFRDKVKAVLKHRGEHETMVWVCTVEEPSIEAAMGDNRG